VLAVQDGPDHGGHVELSVALTRAARANEGSARGGHDLVEGVGDAVLAPTYIAPRKTLYHYGSNVGGSYHRFPPEGNLWELNLICEPSVRWWCLRRWSRVPSTASTTMSLGGVVRSGLNGRRYLMDTDREGVLAGIVTTSITDLNGYADRCPDDGLASGSTVMRASEASSPGVC
jgi:hypothetical protein